MHAIAQRSAKALKGDLDNIAIGKPEAFAKTQAICSKKMDMNVSRLAMLLELKMVVLEVLQTVAHVGFTAVNILLPQQPPAALNLDLTRHRFEFRIKHQLRPNGAIAQL